MPFQKLIDPETGKYRDASDLRSFFDKELDPSKETITSCGTGISTVGPLLTVRGNCKYHLFGLRSKRVSFKEESLRW
jgi:hypothetical protein